MATNISPLASVHPGARLGENVQIMPFAYIDDNVEIGDNSVVRPHASILSGARIGRDNVIYEGCVISASPQDFRWKGEDSLVRTGDRVVIREHVIINRSIHPGGETSVGDRTFVMAQGHIAHDSKIGSRCVLGNGVKIAGDVNVGDFTILSSGVIVHEGYDIGEWVLVKGGCRVNGHVPPYAVMAHNPIAYSGVNAFIMRRGKMCDEVIEDVAQCFRHLYQSNTSTYNALRRIEIDLMPSHHRDRILDFVRAHGLKIAAVSADLVED